MTDSNSERQITTYLTAYQKAVKNVPLLKYSWVLIATISLLSLTAYLKLKNSDVFFYAIGVVLISLFTFLLSFLLKTKDKFNKSIIRFLIICIVVTLAIFILSFGSFIILGKPQFYSHWFPNQNSKHETNPADTSKKLVSITLPYDSLRNLPHKTRDTIYIIQSPKEVKRKNTETTGIQEKKKSKDTIPAQIINVSSTNQSGGITANQVIVGDIPRKIDQKLRNFLLENLTAIKKKALTVESISGDIESSNLADEIIEFLQQNGFNVECRRQSQFLRPVKGVFLNPNDSLILVGSKP